MVSNHAPTHNYNNLTIPELKEVCRGYGLQVGGNKVDLLSRLAPFQHALPPTAKTNIAMPAKRKLDSYITRQNNDLGMRAPLIQAAAKRQKESKSPVKMNTKAHVIVPSELSTAE